MRGSFSPQITNAGFSNIPNVTSILWNFYEATSFYAASVSIPGTVLAPFANANLGGNIDGALIAENVVSTNEFHYFPFHGNWLVP